MSVEAPHPWRLTQDLPGQQPQPVGQWQVTVEAVPWVDGIEQILVGYIEEDFIDNFLKFVLDLASPETDLT